MKQTITIPTYRESTLTNSGLVRDDKTLTLCRDDRHDPLAIVQLGETYVLLSELARAVKALKD